MIIGRGVQSTEEIDIVTLAQPHLLHHYLLQKKNTQIYTYTCLRRMENAMHFIALLFMNQVFGKWWINEDRKTDLANCRQAEVRISTSLHAKYRFYESYWLFYRFRIHWFFPLIVFSSDTGRGKAPSNWCADSTDVSRKKKKKEKEKQDPKADTWQDRSAEDTAGRSCRVGGVTRTCWATLPPSCLAAGRRTLVSCAQGFDLFALASVSSIYKGHEREWVIHLCVCMWVWQAWPISAALTRGWHFSLTAHTGTPLHAALIFHMCKTLMSTVIWKHEMSATINHHVIYFLGWVSESTTSQYPFSGKQEVCVSLQ